jgi:hypothetical protein
MRSMKIIWKHCGNSKVIRDNRFAYAVVQEKDTKTDEPIGAPNKYYISNRLFCGKIVYAMEKQETTN